MVTMETHSSVQEVNVDPVPVLRAPAADATLPPPVTKTTATNRWSATAIRVTQVFLPICSLCLTVTPDKVNKDEAAFHAYMHHMLRCKTDR